MTPTRVFVVAPAPMIRAGLRSMLATVEGTDVRIVGEAASPIGSSSDPLLSQADVVLVADEELLEETALAVADDGTQALLLLSEDDQVVPRLRALPLRGWGVVAPDAPPEELAAAVAAAAQGLIVLPKPLTEQLLHEPAPVEELPEPLTAREREVLELLGRGLSNKLIARELHISEYTVKFHVSGIYQKLGVNSRTEAINRGARLGLISL
jgi:DNA-binding NarL/FixJ family response regulator